MIKERLVVCLQSHSESDRWSEMDQGTSDYTLGKILIMWIQDQQSGNTVCLFNLILTAAYFQLLAGGFHASSHNLSIIFSFNIESSVRHMNPIIPPVVALFRRIFRGIFNFCQSMQIYSLKSDSSQAEHLFPNHTNVELGAVGCHGQRMGVPSCSRAPWQ